MTVFVGFASAYGSTAGIAERIAERLRARGLDVVTAAISADGAPGKSRDVPAPADLRAFEAVILGSAIHNGTWLPGARDFVERATTKLVDRPTWLFSVGSVGDSNSFLWPPIGRWATRRRKDSRELAAFRATIGPRDHRYFAGAIAPHHFPLVGRIVLRAFGGHYGDHRDWDDIDAWAERIADTLIRERATAEPPAPTGQ